VSLVQILIAIAIGAAIFGLGLWGVRLLATPIPPESDPDDIIDVDVAYRCTICGLRLVVTHATGHDIRAPRHCREEMEPVP
jgi:hypothetical protein